MRHGGVSHHEEKYVVYSEALCVFSLLIPIADD